jgi:hypothetical protein
VTDSNRPTPVVYRRTPVRHQLTPQKLQTERIATAGAGAPIDIYWDGGTGTFFIGDANAVGRIDEHHKVTVFPRTVGHAPQRIAQGYSRVSNGSGYRLIDPEGGRVGFFRYDHFEEEDVLASGVRPLSLGPTSYYESDLVGTDGGYLLDYGRHGKVLTPANPLHALGSGPGSLVYYLSGTTLHWLSLESGVGRPLAMPYPIYAEELVWGPGTADTLAYLDKVRNVIGLIREYRITEFEVEEYELPPDLQPRALKLSIADLWFTGRGGASVFRFDRLRTLYEYPCADPASDLTRLSFGANEVWFTEPRHAAVSRADIVGF